MIRIDAALRIVAGDLGFTEAPRWNNGKLFFSDLFFGRVHSLDEDGILETLLEVDDTPSGLGFLPDGDLLVVLMDGARIVRRGTNGWHNYADLSAHAIGPNDMLVDQMGRAYVGQLGFDHRIGPRTSTSLLLIEPEGAIREVARGLWGPNGMVLSETGRTMYVAESESDRVTMFDRSDDGALTGAKIAAQLPHEHRPDGMCGDSEGGLWVAVPFAMGAGEAPRHFGPGIVRIGDGGEATHLVPASEGRRFVACTFGGENRQTLFTCSVTTASRDKGRARREARIECIEPGFRGAGVP